MKGVFLTLHESVIQHKLWLHKNTKLLSNLKQYHHRVTPIVNKLNENKIVKSVRHVKTKSCSSANLMTNHARLQVITAKNIRDVDINTDTVSRQANRVDHKATVSQISQTK